MQKDLDFLSGEFLDFELPKDQIYLAKYFDSDIQFAFLKYYLVFGDIEHFTNHTGIPADKKYLKKLITRLEKLVAIRNTAKKNLDFDLLWRIEAGRYKYVDIPS